MSERLDPQQAQELAAKIERFAATLSDAERDAFAMALWNGDVDGDAPEDVAGYAAMTPMGITMLQVQFTRGSSAHMFPSIDREPPGVMGKGPIPG